MPLTRTTWSPVRMPACAAGLLRYTSFTTAARVPAWVSSSITTPSQPRCSWPLLAQVGSRSFTMLMGTAKPMPCPWLMMAVFTPTTSPAC